MGEILESRSLRPRICPACDEALGDRCIHPCRSAANGTQRFSNAYEFSRARQSSAPFPSDCEHATMRKFWLAVRFYESHASLTDLRGTRAAVLASGYKFVASRASHPFACAAPKVFASRAAWQATKLAKASCAIPLLRGQRCLGLTVVVIFNYVSRRDKGRD